MRYNKILNIGLLIILCVPLTSYGSLSNLKDWMRRIRVSSAVQLGQYRIPFLSRKVRLNCSLELCTKPMTFADLADIIAEKIDKIGHDLGSAASVIQVLFLDLWQYIKNNPVDSVLIGGGVFTMALVLVIVLQRLLTPQSSQERCRGVASNYEISLMSDYW